MITLKEFMEVVDYRITEGSTYGWQCFGSHAYCLDSWVGGNDGHTISVIFDTKDQTVYQAEAHDYQQRRAYRLTHPDYVELRKKESQERNVDDREAWDDIRFVELESVDDFLEKAQAIASGEDYDTRVSIPVDIPDDVLFTLMKDAHQKDITLNQLFENILTDAIDRAKFTAALDSFDDSMDFDENHDEDHDEDHVPATVTKRHKKKD